MIFGKIREILTHYETRRFIVVATKLSLFVACIGYFLPYIWHQMLPPQIKLGGSYLEFVCATILSYFLIASWIKRKSVYMQIDDDWYVEEDYKK
ncbi:MAG: hypothetical protein CME70_19385 [Halobacteriovorax sp.]|nr:hypothetical protein [Halobacteriovorax sp.]MBK26170.1 hypothetical protein [Halobacteriovorax sp.]|tara:strand:+ start:2394 stop:2675 length:282 start_codon:yes stop_codon:yes gene_type:complete